jgi:hypothetical protein
MGKLEDIVANTAKGLQVGLFQVADLVGTLISETDFWISGAGPSSKRALPTISNYAYQLAYNDQDEKLPARVYISRAIGQTASIGSVGYGLYSLALTNPLVALAVPAFFGAYSLAGTAIKYISNFIKGENVNGKRQKSSFYDGFKFGYHQSTNFLQWPHAIESFLTGRGLDNSHIQSTTMQSANRMRRNFKSTLGLFIGAIVGEIANIASFLIIPTYKTIRDLRRTINGKEYDLPSPAYSLS